MSGLHADEHSEGLTGIEVVITSYIQYLHNLSQFIDIISLFLVTFKDPLKMETYVLPISKASIIDEFGFHSQRAENRVLRRQQRFRRVKFCDLFRMSMNILSVTSQMNIPLQRVTQEYNHSQPQC